MRTSQRLLLLLAALGLLSCGPAVMRDVDWQESVDVMVWPEPPDPPQIQYLRSLTGAPDFKTSAGQGGGVLGWLLGEEREDLPLLTPFAVASGPEGVVWVADNGSRMLYRIDLRRHEVGYVQLVNGLRLTSPSGVACDVARDRVYLADAALDRVVVLDLDADFVGFLAPPGGFERPAGMAVSPSGELYVADVLAGRVAVFDKSGTFLRYVDSKAQASGRFQRPLSVALGPAGEVLVVDTLAFRVEVQTADGELLALIGKVGDSPGAFARPRGVAVDQRGRIYVSDAAFDNVQVFDMTGQLLMYFGEAGAGSGQFNLPAGLTVDAQGRMFVADSYNHRIQVFHLPGIGP